MDFEMNQIDNSHPDELKICKNEIIEIGAVKLDDTYKEIDSFKTYVKPGITPVTSRITNLTGITNEMVDDAPDFAIAMDRFIAWGLSADVIYAWSENDLRQFNRERKLKSYNNPDAQKLASKWKDFQKEYFKGNKEAAEGFEEDNPLANSSHYEIYLNDVSMQKALVTYLKGLDGVREVHQSEVAANTLSDLNSLIGYISAGIILILIAVAVFLISNTIRTGISVRREEIAIMKLIGATDYFVRAPFIVEGVMIGLIGSVLPLILLYFVYSSVITYVSEKFVFLRSMLNFLPVGQVFRVLVPVALLLGVGIGFLGSRVTTKRHLNV